MPVTLRVAGFVGALDVFGPPRARFAYAPSAFGEVMVTADRRRTLRVPVRGVAVVHSQEGPLHGAIANLSYGGALVDVATPLAPFFAADLELHFGTHRSVVGARTVRVEVRPRRTWRVAVAFEGVDAETRDAIDATISNALAAARRRPILVIDDRVERRDALIALLAKYGMTPLAPKTPLDAIDLLTRAQLHIDVCLLARGFGCGADDLATVLEDSFPWVTTTEIDDDLETSAGLAIAAWEATPIARLGSAIG